MDAEFLAMLRCPITRRPLAVADGALIDRTIAAQQSGDLRDRQGREVEPLDGGLVDEDGQWLYAIRGGIPSLIPDQAIEVSTIPAGSGAREANRETDTERQ